MRPACSMVSDFDRRINPGINPSVGRPYAYRIRRRRQMGGTVTCKDNLSFKDFLINAAAGVLNKQKKRINKGVKKRRRNVTKPWVDMGKESGAIKQKGSGVGYATTHKPKNHIPVVYQYHQ